MRALRYVLVSLSFFLVSPLFSQQSRIYTYDGREYQEAVELYNNRQYQAAQNLFIKVMDHTDDPEMEANAAYYRASAGIRLNQLGADKLMEDFVDQYPTSVKRNSAFMDVADYYFDQGKYPLALRWYNRAEGQGINRSDREEYNFKKGYCLFVTRKYADARKYLERVSASPKFGSQAKYYIGYMAYQSDDYNQANQYFDQVAANPELNANLSYYKADMNFKLGNFDKAIALAKEQLPTADRKEISQLNKIIGESYFNKGLYESALPYLKAYKGSRGQWSLTDYYQLGYVYYKQGRYEEAIAEFNKIVNGANGVAQNGYYHLGECYLRTGRKQEALNAFRNAAQMDFSPAITKDAWLNYSRLSYDIGNPYESVPGVLTAYLEQFPDSEHREEVRTLLVDSYITSRNYVAAMELLQKNRAYGSKEVYQKVAFYYGLELFTQEEYTKAASYLEEAIDGSLDQGITARATFWKAECDYLEQNYPGAVIGFKQFKMLPGARNTPEYAEVDYHLGYAYFNQKDYPNAAANFKTFADQAGNAKELQKDAWLRLGDSRFVNRDYWPAMEAYNKVIAAGGKGADYAAYQKAVSYGFVDRTENKISSLTEFVTRYPNSTLKDDALYELGNTYINNNSETSGVEAYRRMVREYPMSSLVPKAILKEGLVYYNKGDNQKALERFKTVVNNHGGSEEAMQAVATAKLIYVDEGRVNEYAQWVKGIDFVEVTNEELDRASFESAERHYIEKNGSRAIRSLRAYLDQFPKGIYHIKAHYYLAEMLYAENDHEGALGHYEFVANAGGAVYNEQSLSRVADIYLEQRAFEQAIPFLERLETEANYEQNILFAGSNLMKAFYELKQYDKALAYAGKMLDAPGIDDRIKGDAWVVIARSAMETGDETRAKEAYEQVGKVATGALAAEALYFNAYFLNKEGDYEGSNSAAQKLAKDYAAYRETGAKGLVLMARNFYALDDAFQATYILENVIKNFEQYPDVVADAKLELEKINAQETIKNQTPEAPDQK
ncbi:tetratricopeptide repeat protein [Robertkochia sediminum]|uniref:tetratricopeptide repeat protein n=1 Tax=Robertkochia sediminum TaxID=2785326 RepID=UPI0019327F67|nr:tetratricopeptide repeat protein [Robertkochia sediminum]MBL7472295.1 tetratricopeptide repeat protein [Robertkochia sediminum]